MISKLLCLALGLIATAQAQYDDNIVGTWTTKSKKVFTGPRGFFNPVEDRLIEPDLPGISYSFTNDGHYEEAYYRAIPNPTTPACPSGIMQWQHGTYEMPGNGSLILTPFAVDGRQLMSSPCSYDTAVYIRWNTPEMFKRYEYIASDGFHAVPRLNLFRFDGSPQVPMYLAYKPPQMLPTSTLNPTNTPTASGAAATGTKSSRVKRGVQEPVGPNPEGDRRKMIASILSPKDVDADKWWWVGVGLTALGTVMYMLPTSA